MKKNNFGVIILLLYTGVYFVPTSLLTGKADSDINAVDLPVQQETDLIRRLPTCEVSQVTKSRLHRAFQQSKSGIIGKLRQACRKRI